MVVLFHENTTITEVFMYEDILKKLKDECRYRNLTEKSVNQYAYHTSSFLKWVGNKPLDELTLQDARDYTDK